MKKKEELINILNDVFVSEGFKRKGNYWLINGNEITKIINLQKSQFGNYFYINYGYILDSIPLNGMMHIYNRLTSFEETEREKITSLLDLSNDIPDEERKIKLHEIINEKLITHIKKINTEDDLLAHLNSRPHLNDIPLIVKKHFNLPID